MNNKKNNKEAINWLKSTLCGDDMDDLISESYYKIEKNYKQMLLKKNEKKDRLKKLQFQSKSLPKLNKKLLIEILEGNLSNVRLGYKSVIRSILRANNNSNIKEKNIYALLEKDLLNRSEKLNKDIEIYKEDISKVSTELEKLIRKLKYRNTSIKYGMQIINHIIKLFYNKKWLSYKDYELIMEDYLGIRIESDDYREFKKKICSELIKIINSRPEITKSILSQSISIV